MKRYLALAALVVAPLGAQPLKLGILDKLKDKATEVVDVNLSKDMLKLGTSFLGDGGKTPDHPDNADLKKLTEGLDSILVKSFEFDEEGAYTEADVRQIVSEMASSGWTLMVSVEEKKSKELMRVWGKPGGIRLLTAEPKELTVVEIIGKISLDNLKDLSGLGVPNILRQHTAGPAQPPKKKEE